MDESYGSCECRRHIKRFCVEISGQIGTVFVKKNTAFLGKGLQKKRKGVTRFAAGVPSILARCRVARTADRRHFVLAAKTMALNLAECRSEELKSACIQPDPIITTTGESPVSFMPRFRLLCHRAKPRLTYLYPRKRFSYPFSCSGLPVYAGLILALSLFPSHLSKTLSRYGQPVTYLPMRR